MRVLITGGAGFIGSHLIECLLTRGFEVIAIDNLSYGNLNFIKKFSGNRKFKFLKLDLCDIKNLEKNIDSSINTVFHLAANSDIMRSSSDPQIDFKNTTIATFNLLNVLKQRKIKKIVYSSGSGVYGDWKNIIVSEKDGPLLPVSMYGATKLSAEAMIYAYSNLFDIQCYVLRPANIIGSRPTHGVIYDFVNKLKKDKRKLTILGNGNQNKSYIYIDDFINGMLLVWEKAKNRINLFNVSTDDLITVNEIARLIIKEMVVKHVKIVHTGGSKGWNGDVPIVKINNEAIKRLGWKNKYTTYQAVQKTIRDIL